MKRRGTPKKKPDYTGKTLMEVVWETAVELGTAEIVVERPKDVSLLPNESKEGKR